MPAAAAVPALEISVSDPIKQGEGLLDSYMSYKISTKTSLPQFKFPSFCVIRRFSDFVWLHDELNKEFAGIIIPPLPEKLMVGRFSPEFVETRRRALEKFLGRIGVHPLLRQSDNFRSFLEANEVGLTTVKESAKAASKGKGGVMQWFSDATYSVTKSLSGAAERPKTADDLAFDEVAKYVSDLEPQVVNVHKHTEAFVRRGRELANCLFEFGLAFKLLGQCENDVLGGSLTKLGETSDSLSVMTAEEAEKEALSFEQPLQDYIRVIGAVKNALSKRDERRATWEAAVADLEAKQAWHAKLVQTPGKASKADDAQRDVIHAQNRVDETKADFDKVGSRVMEEVARFRLEKLADFKHITLDFVQLQIDYAKKMEQAWSALIPELEGIQADESAGGLTSDAAGAAAGASE